MAGGMGQRCENARHRRRARRVSDQSPRDRAAGRRVHRHRGHGLHHPAFAADQGLYQGPLRRGRGGRERVRAGHEGRRGIGYRRGHGDAVRRLLPQQQRRDRILLMGQRRSARGPGGLSGAAGKALRQLRRARTVGRRRGKGVSLLRGP